MEMHGVTEYCEGLPVELLEINGRKVIMASTESSFPAGRSSTQIDVIEMIAWFRKNQPEVLA